MKKNDIIIEVVTNSVMKAVNIYQFLSFEHIPESETDYGTYKEKSEAGWRIDVQYKQFRGTSLVKDGFCTIGCKESIKGEESPDLIRELRSEWKFEVDKPVYFVRRKDDNSEFFKRIQSIGDVFPDMEVL
jgi:hypothetical protein